MCKEIKINLGSNSVQIYCLHTPDSYNRII